MLGTAAIIGLLASWAAAAADTRIIYPTGIFPDDIANIQTAVDELGQSGRNGIIILKARDQAGTPTAFDFGTSEDPLARGSVVVGDDLQGAVEFRGEQQHGVMTIIRGGLFPILMQRDDRIAIRNIRFEGAHECAICVERATGVEIADNVIVETEAVFESENFPGFFFANAILIADSDNFSDLETSLTGRITVERNVIDNVIADFGNGITIIDTDAVVTVQHNVVSNVSTGIRVLLHRKLVRVSKNRVITIPTTEFFFFRQGILFNCGIGDAARAVVKGNEIETLTPDQIDGIVFVGSAIDVGGVLVECPIKNSIIAHNEIVMSGEVAPNALFRIGIEWIALDAAVSHNQVFGNEIRGTANLGIFVWGFPITGAFPTELVNNVFFGNQLEDLEATEADVLFDEFTRDNRYIGKVGETVLDFGTDNQIILRP